VADRVIVLDVRRANEQIKPRDVLQMCGRAGRMHSQEDADVHLVMCHDDMVRWKKLISDPSAYEIKSNFNDVSTFSFHVISQIVRGDIYDAESFASWYNLTLDRFQREKRGEKIPSFDEIAKELHETGSASYDEKSGKIEAKPLGKICAAYYFSPYDVRDWFTNINRLHKKDLLWNDSCHAWALSNIKSAQEWENDLIRSNCAGVTEQIESRGLKIRKGVLARLLATDCVLNGRRPRCDLPIFYSVKNDMSRILMAIEAICSVSVRIWGDLSEFIETLRLRNQYGIPGKLGKLVQLHGIGKATAVALYDGFEIKSEKDILERMDELKEDAPASIKRALTKYRKSKEIEPSKEKVKVSYRAHRRISRGADEYGDDE